MELSISAIGSVISNLFHFVSSYSHKRVFIFIFGAISVGKVKSVFRISFDFLSDKYHDSSFF
jgi:hypothetical protein